MSQIYMRCMFVFKGYIIYIPAKLIFKKIFCHCCMHAFCVPKFFYCIQNTQTSVGSIYYELNKQIKVYNFSMLSGTTFSF